MKVTSQTATLPENFGFDSLHPQNPLAVACLVLNPSNIAPRLRLPFLEEPSQAAEAGVELCPKQL